MSGVTIEDPVINSPFEEPRRHFRFDEAGITSEIVPARRKSSYFMPIPQAKKKGKQELLFNEWTQDRVKESEDINRIRERVARWRQGGHIGVTRTTRRLLDHWTRPDRERRLFFCQIEAVETAIYITEVAERYGDGWIDALLKDKNAIYNPSLLRVAFKMATGSGKTVVMAMLIAWQTLNKLANRQDARFSDAFLIVAPGITIRDRLRVLMPGDVESYYRLRDLAPGDLAEGLGRARIVITNFHAFMLRERGDAAKLTKKLAGQDKTGVNREAPDQMVRRVGRAFGAKRGIVVINDEAHHCYRAKPDASAEKLSAEDRREAKKREEQARVWISGIEAFQRKLGLRAVYDLSATPFFLRGSGEPEGTLFPWVVSDFSLIDAIESGIVKVPRVPVSDDSMVGELPTYRDLWPRIRDGLPKKGRGTEATALGAPELPGELEGAIQALYRHYKRAYDEWEGNAEARARGLTAPVFIVVCNNTNVSNLVFRYIAGFDTGKKLPNGDAIVAPGKLPVLSNVEDGREIVPPRTILVDSEQLESDDAMSEEFKQAAAAEIERFKDEARRRGAANVDALTGADLLREVMNTVGKPGKLGEQVRCVVSVSMLTEGWDANTVTHILGVRAFGTQLLCEQVVGRGLRRMSYAAEPKTIRVAGEDITFEAFATEYAEVFGVPFSFIPTAGASEALKAPPPMTRVRALEERWPVEIGFPRVTGYRFVLPTTRLDARFTADSRYALSAAEVPTRTENAPIVGASTIMTLDELRAKRPAEIAFLLAKLVLEKYFRQDGAPRTEREAAHRFEPDVQAWLFPQVLGIARRWLGECLACKDDTFPGLLLLVEFAHDAADRIYGAIVAAEPGRKTLMPVLRPYDQTGSTRHVDFDTTRPVYKTDPAKCHVSHVVADTGTWEQKVAQVLEAMDEVVAYVKNQNLGFAIPYTLNGREHEYFPDFLVRVADGGAEPLNLIVEVSGEKKKDKDAKVATARQQWVPAINNHGGFGRWAFVEITDPWDAASAIRSYIKDMVRKVRSPAPPIRRTPGVLGGVARVRDTRIAVWMLVEMRRAGLDDAAILSDYPTLSPADLAAAWDHAARHAAEIDDEIALQNAEA